MKGCVGAHDFDFPQAVDPEHSYETFFDMEGIPNGLHCVRRGGWVVARPRQTGVKLSAKIVLYSLMGQAWKRRRDRP